MLVDPRHYKLISKNGGGRATCRVSHAFFCTSKRVFMCVPAVSARCRSSALQTASSLQLSRDLLYEYIFPVLVLWTEGVCLPYMLILVMYGAPIIFMQACPNENTTTFEVTCLDVATSGPLVTTCELLSVCYQHVSAQLHMFSHVEDMLVFA